MISRVFLQGKLVRQQQTSQAGANSGIGVALGSIDDSQMSVPVTDELDKFSLRSSQRTERLAAKQGLRFLAEVNMVTLEGSQEPVPDSSEVWVIATDSEYVFKGMTEWLSKWKVISGLNIKDYSLTCLNRITSCVRPRALTQ